jgi:hypothetical protein
MLTPLIKSLFNIGVLSFAAQRRRDFRLRSKDQESAGGARARRASSARGVGKARSATVQDESIDWTGAMPTSLGHAEGGATPLQHASHNVQASQWRL